MNKTGSAAKRLLIILLCTALVLGIFAGICIYVDPFCHYHAPLEGYDYTQDIAYYLNDGIIRNFDFDSVITGTSMAENFKASEAEEYYGGDFIKITLSGSTLKETNDQLKRLYERDNHPKYVIRCIDNYAIVMDKDEMLHDFTPFEHLYNDNPFDDVNYIFNLEVLVRYTMTVLNSPRAEGAPAIDFDRYCSWDFDTGKELVLTTYAPEDIPEEEVVFTEEDRVKLIENVHCNVTDIAMAHPETTFIYFYPPYSICYWDKQNSEKRVNWRIDSQIAATEEILKCPNVKLYAFDDHYDIVCDLDRYRDESHYTASTNAELLKFMAEDTGLLTAENYQDYYKEIRQFYTGYDYASLRG